ncbi:hypothetical protein SPSIL_009480 [Sporomusa silvacetica DSM 10669]|uniref:Uncharacterized protein n=1 Tax=Sporomusa silvacetica DSM 10669 TaxID=1123289 RepID=A0ABZ3IGN2_9FIRM|nr:hypothetical protein SPSIL_55480 [Sporomusa silvacetica DSM 10669]
MVDRPLLAAFRFTALSSSAPGQPPLALRVVSCRAAIRQLSRGAGQEAPCTRTQTCRGYDGWPRTLRGASAGHSGKSGRKTIDRPSRASCRPPGTKTKHETNRSARPPAATRLSQMLTVVPALPWRRPSRPVDTKSVCPLSVLPSPRAPHPT